MSQEQKEKLQSNSKVNNVLLWFAYKYHSAWDDIYNAIKDKEDIKYDDLESMNRYHNNITIIDNDYPENFKHINKPPFVLFYHGKKELLEDNNRVAIICGEWQDSGTSISAATLIKDLVTKGVTIVASLQTSGDRAMVKEVLSCCGKLILVIPDSISNIDNIAVCSQLIESVVKYNNSLILSTAPDDECLAKSLSHSSTEVYNMVSGLGDNGVFVPYASQDERSIEIAMQGALILGRNIYCLPNLYGSDSLCNKLIGAGAMIAYDANSLCNENKGGN